MKILITGANGMLAKSVKKRLEPENELICTDVADLDITDEEAVLKFVAQNKPDYIINCAAFTAVDKAETAGEIVERINADGPENLAKAAKANNSVLVHISTDYVFGGDLELEKDYKEEDEKARNLLQDLKGKEDVTLDGKKIKLYANIGGVKDVASVLANDAAGIGLFRSEFLYLESEDYPSEESQFQAYKTVAENMAGRKVIVRTLDIGASPASGKRFWKYCHYVPDDHICR